MGNKDKNFKKCRRKIRIRLADPNNPESYICEVLDSSFESEKEENDSENVKFLTKSKEDDSKPKNYFELLMSKDCRRNSKIKQNAGIQENYKQQTVIKTKDKRLKQEKSSKNCSTTNPKQENDSSDDENLLQLKRKCQLQNSSLEEIIVCEEITQKTASGMAESDEELHMIFESSKIEPNKKSLNILNYFSKANHKNTVNEKKLNNAGENKISKISQRKNNEVDCKNTENSNQNVKKFSVNELNKENLKLAPLFYKKEKRIFDSCAQKARLDFLYNSPAIVKKLENRTNDNNVNFFEVAHVQQKNYSPCWSVREIILPLPRIPTVEIIPKIDKKFKFGINNQSVNHEKIPCKKIQINGDFINKLKSKYTDLDLDLMIDNLKRKRDEYFSLTEELDKSKNIKKSPDETGYEVLNMLWIEKYKPKSSDILGNGKALKKLKDWLESWKSFDEGLKALIKSKPKDKAESDDDDAFLNSDDDEYGLKTPGNVCILYGPHASGKTALVFALANELEFKVLELNASSKRTGKKVLADLQEATQSHKVHHLNVLQNDMPPRETKKKKKKKRKSKKLKESAKIILPSNSDCKISLILIEDADVVFEEHDEGFISAITSLVQTSKRPLIFITQEPGCAYLENFKRDQCLILEMQRPCFYKSCAVLDIVSSLEGAHTEEEFLKNLVRRNRFDLRKSLLELQFWTQSSGNSQSLQNQFDLGQLWWGLGKFLYKKDLRRCVKSKGCKRKRQNDLFDFSDDDNESIVKKPKLNSNIGDDVLVSNSDTFFEKRSPIIGSYFKILDLVSVMDTFCVSLCSESIFGYELKPKDGLSLEENLEEVSCGRNFTEKVSEEMVKLSTEIFAKDIREKKHYERNFDFSSPSWEEIRWQEYRNKADEKLSSLVPLQSLGEKRSLRLDYLPVIRNICRVEKIRLEEQPKRKNRFSHYLWNIGPKLDDDNLEVNCKIFNG